jgi:hypothetical protein
LSEKGGKDDAWLTGPVLVVETIVFDFCSSQGWDYLSFRLWIGIWIGRKVVQQNIPFIDY